MKRKVCLILFVGFVLLGGLSAYKLINDQVEYHAATDYYQSVADSWVKQNPETGPQGDPSASVPSVPVSPADTEAPFEQDGAAVSTVVPSDSNLTEASVPAETPAGAGMIVPSENPVPSDSAGSSGTAVLSAAAFAAGIQSDPAGNPFTADQPPISVDFGELQKINEEVVGWIYCDGTPINYPVMQAKDNVKYLNVLPDRRYSLNGSVFIDCDCEPDFTSDNTLMYGHNRKTGMFACLPRFKNKNYYQAHSVMWLLTPASAYKVIIFSGFDTRAESWVYETSFFREKFRTEYVDQCLRSSDFEPLVDPVPGARLLTLSTCHYFGSADGRYVIIGMLIPCVRQ